MKKIDYSLKNLDPFNTSFLIGLPVVGLLFLFAHIRYEGFNPYLLIPAFVMYVLTVFSISAGYHRLFAHRSFKANKIVKLFLLVFGAASGESTAVKWASDHRVHHSEVDTDNDPYNIHQGFFYAHMGWVMLKADATNESSFSKDLVNDPLVMWQHRHGVSLAIWTNILICLLVGWISGDYLGSIAIVGLLRLTFVHHITFFINSLCHMVGTRPYDDKQTARDSILLALITFGEGYHNFHHSFQSDYRNGHLWYQWDPTKWILGITTLLGWTFDLKRASDAAILKSRMSVEQEKFEKRIEFMPAMKARLGYVDGEFTRLKELKESVVSSQRKIIELKAEYKRLKLELIDQKETKLAELKLKIEKAKEDFQSLYLEWKMSLELKPVAI